VDTVQFGREAASIAQLQHPNIVALYDYGHTEDVWYLVTPYVIGVPLTSLVAKKPLEPMMLLAILRPVAEALDYIHAQQIVHRDLKPDNILIDTRNIPYLTDFGLARQLEDGTSQRHSRSGTPHYMPPEQLTGGEVTIYSDQFSFGIILFQLLTGQLPFEGKFALGMQQLKTPEKLPELHLIKP